MAAQAWEDALHKCRGAHLPGLCQAVLSLLAISRTGLTFEELEDILSFNDDLINVLFELQGVLPMRRMSTHALRGIINDLLRMGIVKLGTASLIAVYQISNDECLKVCQTMFFPTKDMLYKPHMDSIDYFTSKWAGELPKPYRNSDKLQQLYGLPAESEAIRHVALQPIFFDEDASSSKPKTMYQVVDDRQLRAPQCNLRRLAELPHHFIALNRWDDLLASCLSNHEWLVARLATAPYAETLTEMAGLPPAQLTAVQPILTVLQLREVELVLKKDPFQLASQLAGHLLAPPRSRARLRGIPAVLLEGARLRGQLRETALMPMYACLPYPDKMLHMLKDHENQIRGLAAANDGTVYVSVSDDKDVKVWGADYSRKPLKTIQGSSDWIRSVALCDDGFTAIVGCFDASVKIYDLRHGRLLRNLEGHYSYVNAVAISPDGWMAISCSEDSFSFVWNLNAGQIAATLEGHTASVTCVCMCRHSKRAYTGSLDRSVIEWDYMTGALLHQFKVHPMGVTAVKLTIDDEMLLSGCEDGIIRRLDLDSLLCVAEFKGHTGPITCMDITHDNKNVISSSEDGTVRLWDLLSGALVSTFTADSPVYSCAILQRDRIVVFGTQRGIIGSLLLSADLEEVASLPSYLEDGVSKERKATGSRLRPISSAEVQEVPDSIIKSDHVKSVLAGFGESSEKSLHQRAPSVAIAADVELEQRMFGMQMAEAARSDEAKNKASTLKGFAGLSESERQAEMRRAEFEQMIMMAPVEEEAGGKRKGKFKEKLASAGMIAASSIPDLASMDDNTPIHSSKGGQLSAPASGLDRTSPSMARKMMSPTTPKMPPKLAPASDAAGYGKPTNVEGSKSSATATAAATATTASAAPGAAGGATTETKVVAETRSSVLSESALSAAAAAMLADVKLTPVRKPTEKPAQIPVESDQKLQRTMQRSRELIGSRKRRDPKGPIKIALPEISEPVGFAAVVQGQMTAEEKQAAFERMILGDVDIEREFDLTFGTQQQQQPEPRDKGKCLVM